ncbi:thioredoxin domain-containing protein [Schaalia sp. Marseille-Q2122]|uniref:DsbA family protein n=1 Tax=Schaalia sp. Marseille-Q2122 TaxID=2736604 RepID=UPI001589F5F2|nr:thioredoxin domain-containing protein [Schaalia sp. Marseille-Q2122]
MSQKPTGTNAVRAKAQQMRQEQERADKRMRAIIIGSVSAIVLAIVAVVAVVVTQQVKADAEINNVDPKAVLGAYADGSPIVLSPAGIGEADPSLPILTDYFDYSCHVCADAEVGFGEELVADAKEGKYNIVFQPVNTVEAPYQYAATTASLIVAKESPEHWTALHHALMAYFAEQYNAGQGTVVRDLDKSAAQVREIALSVGVPESLVSTFPKNIAEEYLTASTNAWQAATFEGRDPNSFGTPEFIANGKKKVDLTSFDPAQMLPTFREGLGVK